MYGDHVHLVLKQPLTNKIKYCQFVEGTYVFFMYLGICQKRKHVVLTWKTFLVLKFAFGLNWPSEAEEGFSWARSQVNDVPSLWMKL